QSQRARARAHRAPGDPRRQRDGGGVVFSIGGRSRKHLSSGGSRPRIDGGRRGRPITGAPRRERSMPLSDTPSHTTEARPLIFSKGTPPPCPPHHMRESWLLLRLSPIT